MSPGFSLIFLTKALLISRAKRYNLTSFHILALRLIVKILISKYGPGIADDSTIRG
jgi:hypothetical protein